MKKLIFLSLTTAFILSCSTKRYAKAYSYSPKYSGGSTKENSEIRGNQDKETGIERRIVIYNASVDLVVKIPDSTNNKLSEIARKFDGYVQTLGNRRSVIRVKSDKLHMAVADISQLGKLKSKTISGDDVTDQYTDFQIRLENANNARKRYLELLAKAENVEAALKVEKELERLNGEIDSMEGKLKNLKHLSEYSTITVYMEEKVKPGILGYIGLGLYKTVKWLFVRN